MQNTLPPLSTQYLSRSSNKYTEWKPETSVPAPHLFDEIEVPIRYAENKVPVAAPNERLVEWSYVNELEVSPLSEAERGVIDKPIIQFAKVDSKRNVVSNKHEFENFLVLKMVNTLPTCMDLFVQNKSNMSSCIVDSDKQCLRAIAGNGNAKEVPTEALTSVLFSTMKQISISMTTRQEVKDFVFKVGVQIGLELEMDGRRLICSKVLPDCQASPHEIALDGAEIIAVNEVRVTTIDSFKEQMYLAQENEFVTLKMASYKGGRGKQDDLYHKGTTSTVKVISLLSNIMKTGIDRDHQHDIELPSSSEVSSEVKSHSHHSSPARKESAPSPGKNKKASRIVEDLTPRDGAGSKHSSVKFRSGDSDSDAEESKFEYLEDQKEDEDLKNHTASNNSFIIEDAEGIVPANAKAFIIETDHTQIEGFNKFNTRKSISGEVGISKEPSGHETANNSNNLDGVAAAGPSTVAAAPTVAPTVVTNGASEEESSRHSADDDSTSANDSSTWNYATEMVTTVFPFTAVVCVPPELSRSLQWGYPKQHIQISNYSSKWNIEVNWVDDDSALVPRTALTAGSIHFELCSTEHVWALVASRHVAKHHRGAKDEDKVDTDGFAPDLDPVVMMFRPTYSTMQAGRCTSIIWSPWSSMSISQRLYAKQKKSADEEKGHNMSSLSASGLLQQTITPYIHIQIFDGVKTEYNQRQNQAEEKNPLSNAVKLPDWRKQKQRPPQGSSRANHK